jgi:hypothetical protein
MARPAGVLRGRQRQRRSSAVTARAAWVSVRSRRQVRVGCRHLSDRCPVPRGPKLPSRRASSCRLAARPRHTRADRQRPKLTSRAGQAGRQPPRLRTWMWCCSLGSSHDAKPKCDQNIGPTTRPAHTARDDRARRAAPNGNFACPDLSLSDSDCESGHMRRREPLDLRRGKKEQEQVSSDLWSWTSPVVK